MDISLHLYLLSLPLPLGLVTEQLGQKLWAREGRTEGRGPTFALSLLIAEFQGRADLNGAIGRGFNSERVWSFVTLLEQPELCNFPLDWTQ